MTGRSFKENLHKEKKIRHNVSCSSSSRHHNHHCPSLSLTQVLVRRGSSICKIFHPQYTVHIILMTLLCSSLCNQQICVPGTFHPSPFMPHNKKFGKNLGTITEQYVTDISCYTNSCRTFSYQDGILNPALSVTGIVGLESDT